MADILNIAVSGLKAHQTALAVTGNNISNATTEGYSRQTVSFETSNSQYLSGNWQGTGVTLETVSRIYDEYLTEQVWTDTSDFNYYETLANYAGQIDGLLADSSTGVQPAMESMFEALQAVVDDPSSISTREVLLSEAEALTDRFSVVTDQLYAINEVLNGQIEVMAADITQLANTIAELNEDIAFAVGTSQGEQPNSLLDQRDQLITQLSELVDVTVADQGNSQVNVYIGDGQPLVIGNIYNEVYANVGESDPTRYALYLQNSDQVTEVTDNLTGGTLGASVAFRNEILDPALNSLGKLSLVIAEQFNEQQALGLDYNGDLGISFFQDINSDTAVSQRVFGSNENANPDDREVSVYITDAGALGTSDYTLSFNGPTDFNYTITDNMTGEQVVKGAYDGDLPAVIEMDGLEIRLEAGSFQQGDSFQIMPTRNEATNMEVELQLAEQIAMASPIMTAASYGNQGDAEITAGVVSSLDTHAFNDDGELEPELLIRFTSATTYEVLDNSDPANPVALEPPISNQKYVPGVANTINLGSITQTIATSYLDELPVAATYQAPSPAAEITPGNGFNSQMFSISTTNAATGVVTEQPQLNISANTSAKEIAEQLSYYSGVEASAQTTLQLANFNDDDDFLGMGVSLNGIELTDTLPYGQTKYSEDYPEEVPNPMTPEFIADRINSNLELQGMGITAVSDGEVVTITAINGEDLTIEISGDATDTVDVSNGQDIALTSTGNSPYRALNVYEGFDFTEGGPYSWEFEVEGQGTFQIELSENYATADDMIAAIEAAIEETDYLSNGAVDVSIDERGDISFQSRLEMSGTGIHGSTKVTLGGQVTITADEGVSIENVGRGNNLFAADLGFVSSDMGITVEISGSVVAGDEFTIGNNTDAITDSRNGVAMLAFQSADLINGTSTLTESYSSLVEQVGSVTARAQSNMESAEVILAASRDAVSSISGVNLDEEAAALIQYELAYNANAQVIQVARDMFDTLISTIG